MQGLQDRLLRVNEAIHELESEGRKRTTTSLFAYNTYPKVVPKEEAKVVEPRVLNKKWYKSESKSSRGKVDFLFPFVDE